MMGKILVVVRGEGGFEFFFEGDNRSWRVRDHPEASGWFLVEEKVNGWLTDEFYDSYENAGVQDLQGLYESLLRNPKRTLEGLFGEKYEIEKIIME
jgi:hypothetical protein